MPLKFKLGSVIKHFKYAQNNLQHSKANRKLLQKYEQTRKSDPRFITDITGKNFIVEL